MVVSRIDSDPTAFDRVRCGADVTGTTTIAEVRAHLHRTGEQVAVVYDHGHPVGIGTAERLWRALFDGHGDDPVGPLVDYVTVRVVPYADAQSTVAAFTRAAWDWLCRR